MSKDPKELAIQFRRCLQGQRDLIGFWINREWVKEHYPLFCQALVLVRAPAYKDFAEQLALLLPRKRKEIWCEGRRIKNFTAYRVLDPDATLVELAEEKQAGVKVSVPPTARNFQARAAPESQGGRRRKLLDHGRGQDEIVTGQIY